MDVEAVTPVLPVDDMAQAVAAWAAILGVAPSFVDGDRWAQFDVGGRRIALAGTDRVADVPGVMIKLRDLAAARDTLLQQGLTVGALQEGAHETRCTLTAPGGWPVILYAPRPR